MKPRLLRRAALLCALVCLLVGMLGPTPAWSAGGSPTVCVEDAGVMVTGTASDVLMAVDLREGRVVWSLPMAGAANLKLLHYRHQVIAVDPQGIVTVLEAQSGAQAWCLPALGAPRDAPLVMYGHLLDTLFLRTQAGKQDLFQAIDLGRGLERGTVRWTAPYRVSALLRAKGDTDAVLALCQEPPGAGEATALVVRRLNGADGEPTWTSRPLPGTLKDSPVETSAGLMVVASVTKPLSPEGTASPAPASPNGAVTVVTALRPVDGSLAWQKEFAGAEVDQVSLTSQALLVHRRDGLIESWLLENGKLAWERTPASLGLSDAPAPPTSPAVPSTTPSGAPAATPSAAPVDPPSTTPATGPSATPSTAVTGSPEVRIAALDRGLVYVLAQVDGHVEMIALEAASGREAGRFKSAGAVTSGPWPFYSAPPPATESAATTRAARSIVLLDLLVPPPARADTSPGKAEPVHRLVALHASTLAQRWSFDLSEPLDTPPQVSYYLPGSLVLRQGENILRLDLGSGAVETKAAVTGDIDTEPLLIRGGDALVKCKDGAFRRYDMRSGRKLWSVSTKPWFAKQKLPNLIFVIILSVLIVTYIFLARGGRRLFIRRIAGLAALDEAVGRAAEMGRPVLFTTGMYDVDDNQTLSALSILGHVAQRAAEYETRIVVPCRWAVAMTSSDEVVKTAFLKAGRPDAYRSDDIRYVSEEQFGYVAGVDGIMLRERPAANFYMGQFFGESLILAETGNTTGAIQIAGTAATAQMPFFVAACDYTLLGEELFAASAYLSENPLEVGSLKGQDVAKALLIVLIVVCSLLLPWYPGIHTWLSS